MEIVQMMQSLMLNYIIWYSSEFLSTMLIFAWCLLCPFFTCMVDTISGIPSSNYDNGAQKHAGH